MEKRELWHIYENILKSELAPAMGCTEPVAVALAGALARQALGALPERVELLVSGNIIKNVKSVIVPHTGGRRGLRTAVAAGIVCGDASAGLEVLSAVTPEELKALDAYLDTARINVGRSDARNPFDIQVRLYAGADTAYVRILDRHTNVVRVEKNGAATVDVPYTDGPAPVSEEKKALTIRDIVEYTENADLEAVRPTLERQIEYNMAIAREGLSGAWGAQIGRTLLHAYGGTVWNQAKAMAAAGSDARMNGCELPVVINSGSGNQGITASVPVIVYARHLGVPEEELLRALLVSNLITVHLKDGIGSLAAYCGATSAGAGAGAGICWLYGGRYEEIAHTVVNALAINSGMICDGAKASCAAKIASAVEAGLLGWQMNVGGSEFIGGDGIVIKGVENTIDAVSRLARDGMRETDNEILRLMLGGESL